MRPPTFEQIDPWARGIGHVATFILKLGVANNVALFFVQPPLPWPIYLTLTFWWTPPCLANLILQQIMLRWAIARLRAYEREHPELFE